MSSKLPAASPNTHWPALWIGVFFVLAVNLVFVRLWLQTPPDYIYTGLGFEAVSDKLVYFAMIEQGSAGRLFMYNPHTSELQLGLLFSPHWYMIGQLAAQTGLSAAAAYHSARVLLSILFAGALFGIIRKLFPDAISQSAAFAVSLFGSGLGWLYYITHPKIQWTASHWLSTMNQKPADLYVTEMNTFTNFVQSPLFMLSYLLILAVWYLLIRTLDRGSLIVYIGLFASTALLVLVHPYDAVVVGLVGVSLGTIRFFRSGSWDSFQGTAALVTGVVAGGAYHLWSLMQERSLSGWLSQNLAFSPQIGAYLWGLGIFFPLWILGVYELWRRREKNAWWLIMLLWSCAILLSIYLPLNVNRRFTNGWFIPVALIASYGIISRWQSWRQRALFKMGAVMTLAIVGISGTLYQLAQYSFYKPAPAERFAYYLSPELDQSLRFASANVGPSSVLASNEDFIAMLLGAHSTARLYAGHPDQTVQYHLKRNQLDWFFAENTTEQALQRKAAFLRERGITYIVLYRPSAASDWPYQASFLRLSFENPLIAFFEIKNPL